MVLPSCSNFPLPASSNPFELCPFNTILCWNKETNKNPIYKIVKHHSTWATEVYDHVLDHLYPALQLFLNATNVNASLRGLCSPVLMIISLPLCCPLHCSSSSWVFLAPFFVHFDSVSSSHSFFTTIPNQSRYQSQALKPLLWIFSFPVTPHVGLHISIKILGLNLSLKNPSFPLLWQDCSTMKNHRRQPLELTVVSPWWFLKTRLLFLYVLLLMYFSLLYFFSYSCSFSLNSESNISHLRQNGGQRCKEVKKLLSIFLPYHFKKSVSI